MCARRRRFAQTVRKRKEKKRRHSHSVLVEYVIDEASVETEGPLLTQFVLSKDCDRHVILVPESSVNCTNKRSNEIEDAE
jgi:hypothetical protein